MINAIRVLIAVVATALAVAAPAAADEAEYLHLVQPKYTFLSAEQLLSEGIKVCKASRAGMLSPDAVQMVQKDLAVSVGAAGDIVAAAVVTLDC
ncbi:MAG TPA: hypothetical protein VHI10_18900 [Mycobacterium sp.]|nr:hypothetical protein [Mycobacterium sp.]